MVPVISLCTFIFYGKKYNYWEHFISNIYLTAQFNFLIIIVQIIRLFNQGNVSYTPFLIIFFTYLTIVYRRLFRSTEKPIAHSLKLAALMILIVLVYTTGLSLAGMM